MAKKSSKISKSVSPRRRKKAEIKPVSDLGIVLAGALVLLRDGLDREECRCDGAAVAGVCPLCSIAVCAPGRPELVAEAQAAVANVVEDEDFTASDSIEVRSALIHWIEEASNEEVEETFVEAIKVAEASRG